MRKTRLVLIPGVKSLDTIGCLLLFLACPTIAFKGQENREVDTICKSQNLKEFWVDTPWPGETDNIAWARGYGGGNWPGDSQKQTTCNTLTARSVVRSRRSEDRRVQARRDVSRDDGIETRKIRSENYMRRDGRREVNNRRADSMHNFSDSRRMADGIVSDEERRMDSKTVRENRRESRARTRSLNREIRSGRYFGALDSRTDSFTRQGNDMRMRSAERGTVTNREVIDGNRNSRASAQNFNREIRSKREVREPETRRAVFDRERTDSTMSAERRTVRNREAIDGRRDSIRHSIRSLDNKSDRQIRNIESRRASATQERADSRSSDERVRSVERRNVENTRVDERTSSRLATCSLQREARSDRNNRDLVSQRDSRFRERVDQRMPEESIRGAERGVMNTRDVSQGRTDSVFSTRSQSHERRSDRDIRTLESRLTVRYPERRRSIRDEQRSVERRVVDNIRALDERRDSGAQKERRDVRSERETQPLDSQVSNQRIRATDRQTISNREIIDGKRLPNQSLSRERRYEREAIRQHGRLTDTRLREGSRIKVRRELENRRESRLSTRSLDRQIRPDRDARETEHRRVDQEKDSRRTDWSFNEQRFDISRESERANGLSTRSAERETRSTNARRVKQNDMDAIRNPQESAQIKLQRRAAMIIRESRRTADEERRANNRERDSRYTRSVESVRSTEERRFDNRRLSMERRDYMLSIQSVERTVQSERERTGQRQRTAQDIRESRMNVADSARGLDYHRPDVRRDSRILGRSLDSQRTLSGRENMNRRTEMDRRRTGGERQNRNIERANPDGRVSRLVVAVENADERLVRGERQRRSTRSLENIREIEMRVRRERKVEGRENRREMEREITREGRILSRFSRRTDGRQTEIGQLDSEYVRSQRLSQSADDVRRFDRRIQLARADRETRRMDVRRSEGERQARHTERISRVSEVDRIDSRLVRGNTRSLLLSRSTLREVKSVSDVSSDILAQRANVRQENRIVDNRHHEVERKTRAIHRITPERLSRHAGDAERADTRRVRDVTQTRVREIRTLEDTRTFDRRMHSADKQRETTRSDSRRGEVENRARSLEGSTLGRITRRLDGTDRTTGTNRQRRDESRSQRLTHERATRSTNERRAFTDWESRPHDRREMDHENRQMRLASADFRRIDNRDSRDAETRRISKDISLKFESVRTFSKEVRRSDRQRRVADVERDLSRIVDKRRDNAFTTESNRRLTEFTDLTNKPRLSDIRERHSSKSNAMEREYGWELSNNFLESSRNALASWLTTDISRTDLNGIAETLMYGGIACFALFSNVNKKVIF